MANDNTPQQQPNPYAEFGGNVLPTPQAPSDPYAEFGGKTISSAPAAMAPGSYQTRKGGPVLNANKLLSPEDQRQADVAGTQAALSVAGTGTPGGQEVVGTLKGLYQTGLGGASLLSKALNKVGIHGEEIDRLARGDVSPFSEAMTTPVGPEQNLGVAGEGVGEWLAGEEGLKALASLAKIPKASGIVKSLINIGKATALGTAQGGIKAAGEGQDALTGAEHGAIGGTAGGVLGEAAPVVTQKLGSVLQKYAPDLSNAFMKANSKANYLYGKNPGQAIVDEGVNAPRSFTRVGQLENIHGQLEAAGNNLDSQIKGILSDPKVASKKLDPIPAIKNTIEDAKKYVTQQNGLDVPKYIERLNKLEDSLLTKYDTDGNPVFKYTGNAKLSPADVSDIKKSVGKNTQWNLDKTDPEFQVKAYENGVRKEIYGKLADLVEHAAPEVGPLNARYANAIEAQALLEKQIALEHGSGGWAGAARKGEWGAALGLLLGGHPYLSIPFIANRITRSIPGRVLESRAGSAVGEALQSPTAGKVAGSVKPALANWIRVQLQDGSQREIHSEDVDKALQQNPGAKVLSQPN